MTDAKFKCNWEDFKKVLETTDIMTADPNNIPIKKALEDGWKQVAKELHEEGAIPWLKDWEKER